MILRAYPRIATGPDNPRWNGGRRRKDGYAFVLRRDHPNANKNGYVREHILVMAEHIGRPIARHEIVHHKNGIRDDNRLENLELMTRSAHHSHHHRGVIKPESIKNLRPMTSEWQREIWRERRQRRTQTLGPAA